jgi:hypothetical protein
MWNTCYTYPTYWLLCKGWHILTVLCTNACCCNCAVCCSWMSTRLTISWTMEPLSLRAIRPNTCAPAIRYVGRVVHMCTTYICRCLIIYFWGRQITNHLKCLTCQQYKKRTTRWCRDGIQQAAVTTRQLITPYSSTGNLKNVDYFHFIFYRLFVCVLINFKLRKMVSKKLGSMTMAFVWFFCWTIQVITGTPVASLEMDRNFGSPLTDEELNCIPTFSKAGTIVLICLSLYPFNYLISFMLVVS